MAKEPWEGESSEAWKEGKDVGYQRCASCNRVIHPLFAIVSRWGQKVTVCWDCRYSLLQRKEWEDD